MSSFFTLPASSKKRKRPEDAAAGRNASILSRGSRPGTSGTLNTRGKRPSRDESISGSESGDSSSIRDASEDDSDASSSHEGETGAERRLRLAERYLENVRNEVQQVGFDAEEVDRDLIAERLKDDVAESKGRVHRFVAETYNYKNATRAHFRGSSDAITGVAVCSCYAYTVSKDMQLVKWELPTPPLRRQGRAAKAGGPLPRQRPKRLLSAQGGRYHDAKSTKEQQQSKQMHHTAPILCVAASQDGRFVATGGQDHKLIMWSAVDLTPLRVFSQHRDSVTALSIERGLNRLYTASYDRTIKTWGLNEQAYVETLFGHQDHIVDIAAVPRERCLSAGARDRTVRLWKVVDETQLVFRGGGSGGGGEKSKSSKGNIHPEGSIERVVLLDDETFVTGSDNGALSLWNIHKKKPIFTYPCAHGLDPALRPEEAFAETDLNGRNAPAPPQPRWITALASVPYSDILVSGSWDGALRIWRITEDKKRIESVAVVGSDMEIRGDEPLANGPSTMTNGTGDHPSNELDGIARGIVNDLAVFERGERGGEGLCIVAALGRTHRLGRWLKVPTGKNGAVVFEIPPFAASKKRGRKKKGSTLAAIRENGRI